MWPAETGGAAAIHQGRGGAHVHFALRVPLGTLDATQARLEGLGLAIEAGWTVLTGGMSDAMRATLSPNRAEICSASASSAWFMVPARGRAQRAIVCVRWIFFCSWIKP